MNCHAGIRITRLSYSDQSAWAECTRAAVRMTIQPPGNCQDKIQRHWSMA